MLRGSYGSLSVSYRLEAVVTQDMERPKLDNSLAISQVGHVTGADPLKVSVLVHGSSQAS